MFIDDIQIGSIIEFAFLELHYLNDTIEVFPHGEKAQMATAMFLSICADKKCRLCIPSKKNHYVFFNTLEFGHVMALQNWQFKNFTPSKAPKISPTLM